MSAHAPADGGPEAFYLPVPGGFEPTAATASPWDQAFQHGGPPLALLGSAIEAVAGEPGLRLARITAEFLRPIPRRRLEMTARVVRPGRRTRMTDAAMLIDGEPAVLARAWHIATSGPPPTTGAPLAPVPPLPPPLPQPHFFGLTDWAYEAATEWRFAGGSAGSAGPAQVWTRVRIPLVAGQPMTGLSRLLVVADSANGVSAELPQDSWLFIPTSITVTLARHATGEWTYLDARTVIAPDGLGLTTADLGDVDGRLGAVSQPLLVAPR